MDPDFYFGSDPDPYKSDPDPKHCFLRWLMIKVSALQSIMLSISKKRNSFNMKPTYLTIPIKKEETLPVGPDVRTCDTQQCGWHTSSPIQTAIYQQIKPV